MPQKQQAFSRIPHKPREYQAWPFKFNNAIVLEKVIRGYLWANPPFNCLQQLQKLKAENERLKAENRALTRVVSKLTNTTK